MSIAVDANIAWQKTGYDFFPADERVALAVQPNTKTERNDGRFRSLAASRGTRPKPSPFKTNLVSGTWSGLSDMTGLCIQQVPAAVQFSALEAGNVVSNQEVGWPGYSGAKMGSLLRIPDGYLVFRLSLGASNDHQGHDIRMARLDASFNLVSGPTWLTRTPGVEESNLHVVPYGADRFS